MKYTNRTSFKRHSLYFPFCQRDNRLSLTFTLKQIMTFLVSLIEGQDFTNELHVSLAIT